MAGRPHWGVSPWMLFIIAPVFPLAWREKKWSARSQCGILCTMTLLEYLQKSNGIDRTQTCIGCSLVALRSWHHCLDFGANDDTPLKPQMSMGAIKSWVRWWLWLRRRGWLMVVHCVLPGVIGSSFSWKRVQLSAFFKRYYSRSISRSYFRLCPCSQANNCGIVLYRIHRKTLIH